MLQITKESLDVLPTRIEYLAKFLDFGAGDEAALQASAPIVGPLVPTILDAVYAKLLSFDVTAAYFAPTGTDPSELSQTHEIILKRKDFLKNYLVKLVTTSEFGVSSPFWAYLDGVAKRHSELGGKSTFKVAYIHIGALLGYVMNLVIATVTMEKSLDDATKNAVISAFNKVSEASGGLC
jgi:hypothetical protein